MLVLLTCIISVLLGLVGAQTTTTADVNTIWLDEYSNGKNYVVDSTPIILVADNENIHAFENGSRTPTRNWTVDLTLYTNLKVICHSVLGLFGTCASAQNNTAGSCDSTSASQYVQNLQDVVNVTVPLVPQTSLYEPSMALLGYCNDTISAFAESGCSPEGAKECLVGLQGTAGLINPLVDAAGDAHVVSYTGTIDAVREDIGEELWSNAIVAVLGGNQPRAANIEYGLWMQQRGLESQGLTLFYIENVGIDDTDSIFSSLGTDLGDQSLSNYVFLNPFRMSEDLFANTTLQYVKKFVISGFPNPGNASIQSSYYRDSTLLTAGTVLKQSDDAGIRDVVCPFAPRTSNASPTGHHHAVLLMVSLLVVVLL